MTVAFELGKTLEEIDQMPLDELAHWLAFFKLAKQKKENKPPPGVRRR